MQPLTELDLIYTPHTSPTVEIIFVHGLNGDPRKTWDFQKKESWSLWIASRFPEARIWSLRYRLQWSWWRRGSMALTDRAVNVLGTIDGELRDAKPIIFICHSYGGLLVKQMLRLGHDRGSEYGKLVNRFRGIVFLGTPHNGSGIAGFVKALGIVLRSSPAITELRSNEPVLRELSNWFTNNAQFLGLKLRVFFETMSTFGVQVVDEDSSNPHVANVTPIAIDTNHFDICVPEKPDVRVTQTIALISEIAGVQPLATNPSWMQRILAAPNIDLATLRISIKRELRKSPNDPELLDAYDYLEGLKTKDSTAPDLAPANAAFSVKFRNAVAVAIVVLIPAVLVPLILVREWSPVGTPPPRVTQKQVSGSPMNVGSGAQYDGYRNPGCQAHEATACVTPQRGGKLIPGSGKVIVTDQSGRAGFKDPIENSHQYCVTFWAATGACETPVFIKGYPTAIEEYTVEEGQK
jgi:pimeloyl-ACP methyl ester carboxylesterase